MSPTILLTVCEGPTDHTVIRFVAEHLAGMRGSSVEIRPLEPEFDATSGRTKRNGWTGVRRWCRRADADKQQRGIDRIGQILALSGAHGILVQVDADAATQILSEEGNYGASITEPDKLVQKAAEAWLGSAFSLDEIRLVISKMKTETWILATFDFEEGRGPFDYENCLDVEDRLIELGYAVEDSKSRRIQRNSRLYAQDINYAPRIIKHIDVVRSRCTRMSKLMLDIEDFFSD